MKYQHVLPITTTNALIPTVLFALCLLATFLKKNIYSFVRCNTNLPVCQTGATDHILLCMSGGQ